MNEIWPQNFEWNRAIVSSTFPRFDAPNTWLSIKLSFPYVIPSNSRIEVKSTASHFPDRCNVDITTGIGIDCFPRELNDSSNISVDMEKGCKSIEGSVNTWIALQMNYSEISIKRHTVTLILTKQKSFAFVSWIRIKALKNPTACDFNRNNREAELVGIGVIKGIQSDTY